MVKTNKTSTKTQTSVQSVQNVQTVEKDKSEVVYAFPTKSKCPRCGSVNTRRTGEYGELQYRQCQVTVCRWKYAVHGEPVK